MVVSQGGKSRGTVPLIKSQGRSKGFFALQSEPLDLQSLATIETQDARALLTNIQYNDTLEPVRLYLGTPIASVRFERSV